MERESTIEGSEKQLGLKEKIIEAIKAEDKEQLRTALCELNKFLTGLDLGYPEDMIDKQIGEFLEGIKEGWSTPMVFYLGDGGLSRLILSERKGEIKVEPSYNSTSMVMEKWKELK